MELDVATILLGFAGITGLYMAWNIGANDVANAMGTSVGSGALTLRKAVIVAAIFEFAGAMLVGGSVTKTIKKGIVSMDALDGDPMLFAVGMAGCLLSAAVWLNVASHRGWPVSTTHSIVGAVIGFGVMGGGVSAVSWTKVGLIVVSWVVSPVLGGVTAFALFRGLQAQVINHPDPLRRLGRFGPVMVFPIFFVLCLALLFKGLKPLKLDLPFNEALSISAAVGLGAAILAVPVFRHLTRHSDTLEEGQALAHVERVFMALQIMTASFVAFAHGSNDVANAVGPLAGVFGALSQHSISAAVEVPVPIMLVGAVGIVVGLATFGYKVIATIGTKITELTPSRGFTAEFAAALTIVLASKMGLPVSTTHTLVGSVIGVGFARSIGAINKDVVRGIIASWFITVPLTALLSALIFETLRLFF